MQLRAAPSAFVTSGFAAAFAIVDGYSQLVNSRTRTVTYKDRSRAISVTGTVRRFASANADRSVLFVECLSVGDVWINAAGQFYELLARGVAPRSLTTPASVRAAANTIIMVRGNNVQVQRVRDIANADVFGPLLRQRLLPASGDPAASFDLHAMLNA